MNCRDMERLLVYYVCSELEPAERRGVEEHTAGCAACAEALLRERRLAELFSADAQAAGELDASGFLLARCRAELNEALDEQWGRSRAWRRFADMFRPAHWFSARPAWSAVALVLVGVVVGVTAPRFFTTQPPLVSDAPTMTVSGRSLSEQDFRNLAVEGINWLPVTATPAGTGAGAADSGPEVELQMSAERPLVVRGTLDDSDVKRVLLYVLDNSDARFGPGVRLDSMEVLRTRSSDQDVRRVLCNAARRDNNAGVRLKALEALREFGEDDQVREALVDALLHDRNPGVRVEAISALRAMAENDKVLPKLRQDLRAVKVLQDLMRNDPNKFVRLQSAAAVREIGPRQTY